MAAPATISDLEWELLLNAITAGFASFAGAYGAWRISNVAERKRRLLDEIADTNRAIALSISVTNRILALKGQHVVGLIDRYQKLFSGYVIALQAAGTLHASQEFVILADLQTISVPHIAIDDLNDAVKRVRGTSAVAIIFAMLQTVLEALKRSTIMRNNLLPNFRGIHVNALIPLYFGLRNQTGSFDQTYSDLLTAISNEVDDCIYFSMLLSDTLAEHGETLRAELGRKAPNISKADFSKSQILPLLPDRSNYIDFETQYRKPTQKQVSPLTIRWWQAHEEGLLQKGLRRWSPRSR